MRVLFLGALGAASLMLGTFACDAISDPTKREAESPVVEPEPSGETDLSTVLQGSLAGNVPEGARVAIVWAMAGGGLVVGDQAPIVNGRFRIDPTPPPGAVFEGGGAGNDGVNSGTGMGPVDSGIGLEGFMRVSPRTNKPIEGTVGESTNSTFQEAYAGFVVFVDGNGNGRFDIDPSYGAPPDPILGGNAGMQLAYFRGGEAADYGRREDWADRKPKPGYNLQLVEGDWLKLDEVQLALDPEAKLSERVCGAAFAAFFPSKPSWSYLPGGFLCVERADPYDAGPDAFTWQPPDIDASFPPDAASDSASR